MSRGRSHIGWLLVVAIGLIGALVLLQALPDPVLSWAPIAVGSLWTAGLIYFDLVIRRDPGRYGLIGGIAQAAGPRSAALVCGLLTLLLILVTVRGRFGMLELATGLLAAVFLVRWLLATERLMRRTSKRSEGMRRKPERWRSLGSRKD